MLAASDYQQDILVFIQNLAIDGFYPLLEVL